MRFNCVGRREFITLLGGAAVAWPLAARAQQRERMRRIGVLMHTAADDPEGQTRMAAFLQGLQEAGWAVGRNVEVDTRWAPGETDRFRTFAGELVALAPDAILASTTGAVPWLLRATNAVPIVFVAVTDPVGNGFVTSLARPGGNATGFAAYEYGISAKWLELLKEIAPNVTRAAVLRDSTLPTGIGHLAAIQSVASSFSMEVSPLELRDTSQIESVITAFARFSNGGLIVPAAPLVAAHRHLIITLAARHRLPAVYSLRYYVKGGGLISYGPEIIDSYRRAAGYVDRILKGDKPAELPVQAPTKYELVINLKTAKALGLDVPPMLLARADAVIE
jgi:putative ABC transport system substrate-binding protein